MFPLLCKSKDTESKGYNAVDTNRLSRRNCTVYHTFSLEQSARANNARYRQGDKRNFDVACAK